MYYYNIHLHTVQKMNIRMWLDGKNLMKINKHPGINQRTLANISRLSLGKVNALVENIEQNGFIKRRLKEENIVILLPIKA